MISNNIRASYLRAWKVFLDDRSFFLPLLSATVFVVRALLLKNLIFSFYLDSFYPKKFLLLINYELYFMRFFKKFSKRKALFSYHRKRKFLRKHFLRKTKRKLFTLSSILKNRWLRFFKLTKPIRVLAYDHILMLTEKKKKRYFKVTSPLKLQSKPADLRTLNIFLRKLASNTARGGKFKSSLGTWVQVLLKQKKKLFLYAYLQKVFDKTYPRFFFKKYNLGRRSILIPLPVFAKKRHSRAAKWLQKAQLQRKERGLKSRLTTELRSLMQNTGSNIQKFHKKTLQQVLETKSNARFLKLRRRR